MLRVFMQQVFETSIQGEGCGHEVIISSLYLQILVRILAWTIYRMQCITVKLFIQ